MPRRGAAWTASAIITLFGAIVNTILAIQVLAVWRSVKWEPESDWELSGDKWQLTSLKIIWGLLSIYFVSAASVCAVGLHGVFKHKPSHVRFYRDYSIADFSFCAFFTALATYAAFLSPARAGVCEAFSHHPELMRDMLEIGLNLENCEQWLERAVFAGLAFMFVIMVIRLHFLLAVANYYSQLARHHHYHHRNSCSSSFTNSILSTSSSTNTHSLHSNPPSATSPMTSAPLPMQRIFVLPSARVSGVAADIERGVDTDGVDLIYAPVPRHSLPKEMQDQATEAWIPSTSSMPVRSHHHHHRRHYTHGRRSRSRSQSRETTGRIKLDVSPDEGLLPAYRDAYDRKA